MAYERQFYVDGNVLIADQLNRSEEGLFDAHEKIDKQSKDIADLKENGAGSGCEVYVGSDAPPEKATIWIDPTGEPTSTEEWEFEMDDGTTEKKTVVVVS